MVITSALLNAIEDGRHLLGVDGERRSLTMHHQAQRRDRCGRRDLVTPVDDRHYVGTAQRSTDRRIMWSKVYRWLQLQADRPLTRDQPVAEVHRILHVGQEELLFQDEAIDFVA